ncbi:MAG: serine/threonine protein kinase [Labilithrix sp.]|nr:serine/threonine protein kinase [Labilithrix sp.]MCW5811604.1 serine/threonine protein kinase [Labilithrix sp.]
MLHPELSMRSDIRQRFIRESHAANAVDHPGVVAVIDDDVAEDGAAFLVMELLAGQSVEELWERRGQRLDVRTALAIGRELCEVLEVAHRAGVVHRDVKPANIFVTDEGRLKVLDFGIARARDIASTQLTDTGMVLGTPAFMAPEQAAGQTSQVDKRTDVWAIGATLFALISGRVVHEGETPQHVAILAATRPARSLAAVAPDAPAAVVSLVDRALVLDKEARWSSADDLRTAIEEASMMLFGDRVLPILRSEASTARAPDVGVTDDTIPQTKPLGTTTARPVSSSAPTRRRTARPIRLRPAIATLASAFARLQLVIGRTTGGAPVSSMAPTAPHPATPAVTARASSSGRWLLGVAAVALGAFLIVVLPRLYARSSERAAHHENVEALSTVADGARVASAASASAIELDTAPPPPPSSLVRPNGSSSAKVVRPTHVSTPLKPRAQQAAVDAGHPNCSSPSYVDSSGKTIWKKECL